MKGRIVHRTLLEFNLATEAAFNSVSCSVYVRVILCKICIMLIL